MLSQPWIQGTLRFSIRDVGNRLKQGVRPFGSQYLALLALYLVSAVIYAFVSSSLLADSRWKFYASLNSLYGSFSKMDTQYRVAAAVYCDKLLEVNAFLYSEIWTDRLSVDQAALRLAESRFAVESLALATAQKQLFSFITGDLIYSQNTAASFEEKFALNEDLIFAPERVRSKLLKSRITVHTYRGITRDAVATSELSPVTLMKQMVQNIERFEESLSYLERYLGAGLPPFNIPKSLLKIQFTDKLPERFEAMRNAYGEASGFFNSTLQTIKQILLIDGPSNFESTVRTYQLTYLLLYVLFLVLAVLLCTKTSSPRDCLTCSDTS